MSEPDSPGLSRLRRQLALYEHPLVCFAAEAHGEALEVVIRLRAERPGIPPYCFAVHPRDLESPQFQWQFQRQLYDCLHDYLIEMFVRTPQDAKLGRGQD